MSDLSNVSLELLAPRSFGYFTHALHPRPQDRISRVAYAILPLLALYNPTVGNATALASGIYGVKIHWEKAYFSSSLKQGTKEFIRGALLVVTLASISSRFNGMMMGITGAVDVVDLILEARENFSKAEYSQAIEKLLRIAVAGCSVKVAQTALVEWMVALALCQAAVCVPQTWRKYQEKAGLEALVTGLIACIRLRQADQHILTLFAKIDATPFSEMDSSCASSSSSVSEDPLETSHSESHLNALSNTVIDSKSNTPSSRLYTHIVNPEEYPQLERIALAWKRAAENRQSVEANNPDLQGRLSDCGAIANSIAASCADERSSPDPSVRFVVCTAGTQDPQQGKVAAIAKFSITEDSLYVNLLVTNPQNIGETGQTKGGGTALLRRAYLEAQKEHLYKITLSAFPRARTFYLTRGFTPWNDDPDTTMLALRVNPDARHQILG